MTDALDMDLVREFARNHSEAAFTELVRRHLNLVYSIAHRCTGNDSDAQDVAQAVFVVLGRKAAGLHARTVLTGWLYETTRNTAACVLRANARRHAREQESYMQSTLTDGNTAADWHRLAPHLEAAMSELGEGERTLLALRFYENKSGSEAAALLGIREAAAHKRTTRALEKLRKFFTRRDVKLSAAAIAGAVSANSVQAAPAGLAAMITAAALSGTTIATTTLVASTKAIAMTTLQKTLVTATVAVLAGAGIYQARQAAQLRDQILTLEQQQAPLAEQIQKLQNSHAEATNRLAHLLAENSRLKSNEHATELLKLRGEVAQLTELLKSRGGVTPFQNESNDPEIKSALMTAAKVKQLKQYLEQNPDRSIPELQFVSETDWANAVRNADLKTDDDVRESLSKVRESAVNIFLNDMMQGAFKKYLAANNNTVPASLSQLEPYFNVPVTDAMLNRYQLLQSGTPDKSADLVKLTTYADTEYDSNHGMSINGSWGGRFNSVSGAVQDAVDAFGKDNHDQKPTDVSQVLPYLKNPMDTATVQKYLTQIAAGITPNRNP